MSVKTDRVRRSCSLGKDIYTDTLLAIQKITTADATDLATAQALANACKAKINELIDAIQS